MFRSETSIVIENRTMNSKHCYFSKIQNILLKNAAINARPNRRSYLETVDLYAYTSSFGRGQLHLNHLHWINANLFWCAFADLWNKETGTK